MRDKTDLKDFYSYSLDWVRGIPVPGSDAPTLFDALQQQLGLKLESSKGLIGADRSGSGREAFRKLT